jgi:acetyltransferase-like isoleucine patch superfamily enzyme
MILKDTDPPEVRGLLARLRRAWVRDSHLSIKRRVQKGLQFGIQLMRARTALKTCNRVGTNARVAGRMRVENHGVIVIGNYLNINSSWVPTELVAGREGRIEIGDDVLINFCTVIAAGKGVSIGSGSMIGPHCIISDVDIPETALEAELGTAKPIQIGENVWLAGRVTIRPGVTIGDGAVVVAGSIVESDVPAHVMASGIPARLLPKLGAVPRTASGARAAQAFERQAARQANSTHPLLLCGSLISDFSLDELAHELTADTTFPVDAEVIPWAQFPQSLAAAPPANARDFCIVWTRPEAAVPAFERLLLGDSIEERQLTADVDAFCELVERSARNYRYVVIPTWTQPAYLRGQPLIDCRPGGVLPSLAAMNLRLITAIGGRANVFVLNAARWHSAVGPSASNPRAWYLGHMAMARPLIIEAARDIRAALGALFGRQRMLLVLDSENALWGGAPPESIASAVPITQAYADFQLALRVLRRRGMLLAVLGKAGKSELLEMIRTYTGPVLREDDFATCSSVEGDEAANLVALATRLGVGLDAVVYIGAKEAVRARVRDALPAVYVPDWPSDILLFPSALQGLRCFDTASAVDDCVAAAQ